MLTCCLSFPPPIISSTHKLHPPKPLSSPPNTDPTTSITTQGNILLSSYLKTKSLSQSLQLFHLLPHKDTVTYNTILSFISTHHHFSTSLNLFIHMLNSHTPKPDTLTFRTILRICLQTRNYALGIQTHGLIVKYYGSSKVDLVLSTLLIEFYGGFGMVGFARKVFDEIPKRDLDVVVIGCLMGFYHKFGMHCDGLELLRVLVGIEGLVANEFVVSSGLSSCAGLGCLCVGKEIHGYVVKAGLGSDVFVGTSLVNMYVKCGEAGCAEKAFWEIESPNVVAWNALMGGEFGRGEVLKLFGKMWGDLESGVRPDHVTFATVLRACSDVDLFMVRQIHGLIVKFTGVEVDVFIGGALFDIYLDSELTSSAENVFKAIRGKDVTAFNLAIQRYSRNTRKEEAVRLFHEALEMGMGVNEDTLTSLMTKIGELNEGKQMHALATKLGFSGSADSDVPIASSLVTMYGGFRCSDDAIRLFNQIGSPDLVLWTSMISSFSLSGESQKALKFYVRMLSEGSAEPPNHYTFSSLLCSCAHLAAVEEGRQIHAQIAKSNQTIKSDIFVTSGLLDMYAKSGYIKEAKRIFDKMPKRDLPAWNSMITGLAQHGYAETAICVFHKLLDVRYLEPNEITFIGVLSACSRRGLVKEGYKYFEMIKKPTVDHYACLIDLLGRAGHLEEALNLIKEMPFAPNEIIWSSVLSSSTIHHNMDVGEYSAKKLIEMNPNDPGTYVAVSNLYAAAGRWEDVNSIRKLTSGRGVRKTHRNNNTCEL